MDADQELSYVHFNSYMDWYQNWVASAGTRPSKSRRISAIKYFHSDYFANIGEFDVDYFKEER